MAAAAGVAVAAGVAAAAAVPAGVRAAGAVASGLGAGAAAGAAAGAGAVQAGAGSSSRPKDQLSKLLDPCHNRQPGQGVAAGSATPTAFVGV